MTITGVYRRQSKSKRNRPAFGANKAIPESASSGTSTARKDTVFVLTVYPDSPAEKAGIRPHDHILAVNGEPAVDAQGEAIVSKVRGPEGTDVVISVRRPGGAPRDLTVTRAKVTAKAKVDARLLEPASQAQNGLATS